MALEAGDAVQEGQTLAIITPPVSPLLDPRVRLELEAQVGAAEAAVEEAESLYEQAGILDRRSGTPDTVAAIRSDPALSERHKAVLLELYETYVREQAARTPDSSRTANVPPTTKESA